MAPSLPRGRAPPSAKAGQQGGLARWLPLLIATAAGGALVRQGLVGHPDAIDARHGASLGREEQLVADLSALRAQLREANAALEATRAAALASAVASDTKVPEAFLLSPPPPPTTEGEAAPPADDEKEWKDKDKDKDEKDEKEKDKDTDAEEEKLSKEAWRAAESLHKTMDDLVVHNNGRTDNLSVKVTHTQFDVIYKYLWKLFEQRERARRSINKARLELKQERKRAKLTDSIVDTVMTASLLAHIAVEAKIDAQGCEAGLPDYHALLSAKDAAKVDAKREIAESGELSDEDPLAVAGHGLRHARKVLAANGTTEGDSEDDASHHPAAEILTAMAIRAAVGKGPSLPELNNIRVRAMREMHEYILRDLDFHSFALPDNSRADAQKAADEIANGESEQDGDDEEQRGGSKRETAEHADADADPPEQEEDDKSAGNAVDTESHVDDSDSDRREEDSGEAAQGADSAESTVADAERMDVGNDESEEPSVLRKLLEEEDADPADVVEGVPFEDFDGDSEKEVQEEREPLFDNAAIKTIPVQMQRFAPEYRYATCAVVGNAQRLLLENNGKAIDKNDVVFRLNQAPTMGFEKHVGSKTTFRSVNNRWAYQYRRQGHGLSVEPNSTFIVTRTQRREFAGVVRAVKRVSSTVGFLLLRREATDGAGELLRELKLRLDDMRGKPYPGKGSPSSGFLMTWLAMQMCRNVTVYGVGIGGGSSWHYFHMGTFSASREFSTDPHHSFDLEADVLSMLDAHGLLRHMTGDGAVLAADDVAPDETSANDVPTGAGTLLAPPPKARESEVAKLMEQRMTEIHDNLRKQGERPLRLAGTWKGVGIMNSVRERARSWFQSIRSQKKQKKREKEERLKAEQEGQQSDSSVDVGDVERTMIE